MREMKDSNVAWMGAIPKTWDVVYPKLLFMQRKQKAIQGERQLTASQQHGVIYQDDYMQLTGARVTVVEKDFDILKHVEAGDFVISMRSFQGGIEYSENSGSISSAYVMLIPNRKFVWDRYYKWVLKSSAYIDALRSTSDLIRDGQAMRFTNFIKVPLMRVPLDEQKTIAAHLDTKCAQIDALIANVQAQIEKLKAYKQSMITEAVTRGLDPSVPMKDSGVEWIGKIASHFNMKRLKDVALVLDQYRKPITADQRSQDADVLYDYYGASGVIDKIDGYTIDDHVMLIGEDGANLRMRNLPLMYEVNGKAWINNHAHILKPKDGVDFNYLFYALEGLDLNPYITGSAQPKLSQENLRIISIPIPALEEQVRIAEFIHKQQSMVDQLLALKQAKIDKLNEYKKSLIYEYVTGKMEA